MSEEQLQPNSSEINPNRERNTQLFEALAWMAHSWGYPHSTLHDRDPRGYRVAFGDKIDEPSEVLEVNYARTRRITQIRTEFGILPADFGFPVTSISFWNRNIIKKIPTPYRDLTEYAIGSDGKIYNFYIAYLFNQKGEGKRMELITCLSEEGKTLIENLEENELFGKNVPRIDFAPKPVDSRCVDIEPQEYDEIYNQLKKIESEELKLLKAKGNGGANKNHAI